MKDDPSTARYTFDFGILLGLAIFGYFLTKSEYEANYFEDSDNYSMTSSPRKTLLVTKLNLG
jgi:hypothetical protein